LAAPARPHRGEPSSERSGELPTIYVAGNVNVDLILGPLADWPRIGTETILPHSELRVGGQAGNTGLALAALGARHRVAASIGNDALGEWLAAAFPDSAGAWPRVAAATSITVGIVHPSRERTFFTTLGHLASLSPQQILGQLPAAASHGDVVLLCGVFLSPLLVEGGVPLVHVLRERGYPVALDTGWPAQGWEAVRGQVEAWLPLLDHVLLNEIETCALAGTDDLDRAATWFLAQLPASATLVVKRGADGARAWRGEEQIAQPAPAVEVIDTVGAGDVFNAAYLFALQRGESLAEALTRGVSAASRAISTSPRRYSA
jgi:sugar/nucleoside kinase (ribokinase family)